MRDMPSPNKQQKINWPRLLRGTLATGLFFLFVILLIRWALALIGT
jgi:hypothetical protein